MDLVLTENQGRKFEMMSPDIHSSNGDRDLEEIQEFHFVVTGKFFERKSKAVELADGIRDILQTRLHNPGITVRPLPFDGSSNE